MVDFRRADPKERIAKGSPMKIVPYICDVLARSQNSELPPHPIRP